jgi:hypothetical protein
MEADIIFEGFLESEGKYGLRYTKVVGDGDSTVFRKLKELVPYGVFISKVYCANHLCKNLCSNLEGLVADNPSYKGSGGLTTTSAIVCQCTMRGAHAQPNG